MKPRLTHLALHVKNLAQCVAFYQKYCRLQVVHRRQKNNKQVIWMAEPGLELDFVMVFLEGGPLHSPAADDFSHLGFALASKSEVDAIALEAIAEGILVWPAVQEPYPVGYYCGLVDPNGNYVEFSYGQPLGPGAETLTLELPQHPGDPP